jgi:hypothetical protein
LAVADQYLITRPQDARPLVGEIEQFTLASARLAAGRLEHIARWTQTAELSNPHSRIPADAVEISILSGREEYNSGNIVLAYQTRDGGRWEQPQFRVKLKNNYREALYCTILLLSESFAVSAGLLPAGVVRLGPGESVETATRYGRVPVELWQQGITQRQDVLKLIACTAEFDPTLLEQPALDLPRSVRKRDAFAEGTLNRHLLRIQTRESDDRPEEVAFDDWAATQLAYTVMRPLTVDG